MSMLFKQVLANLLGSIMVVQIVAHLPLTDVNLPANLLQTFQVMISFVSFDYFAPFEYIDVNFTDVWSYSPNFEWLGYDSVNFLGSIGSIAIFAAIQLAVVLISLMLKICGLECPCKRGREIFSGSSVWTSSLTLIHGTFFEIVVATSISMSMVSFIEYFRTSDKISITCSLFFIAIIIAYIFFVVYLVCFKSRQLTEFHKAGAEERSLKKAEEFYHESLLF